MSFPEGDAGAVVSDAEPGVYGDAIQSVGGGDGGAGGRERQLNSAA